MSMRSDAGICRYCGMVALASSMVRLEDGEYVYACLGCGVQERRAPK